MLALPVVSAAQEAAGTIHEVQIPEAELADWLARGKWRAVDRETFRRMVRERGQTPLRTGGVELGQTVQPQRGLTPFIERAVYTATYSDALLHDGRLSLTVHRAGEGRPSLLRLDPMSLVVDSLAWTASDGDAEASPAVWGAAPSGSEPETSSPGTTAVLLDRKQGTLEGRWRLAGESLGERVEFELELPAAAVTELRLLVPSELELTSTSGRTVGEDASPGMRQWTVNLGSERHCRLTIAPVGDEPQLPRQVLYRSDLLCLVRREGLRLQAGFQLDVPKAPAVRLTFQVPRGVIVYAVRYAGSPLSWSLQPAEDSQRLVVQLPDTLSGRSRTITVEALAGGVPGEPWTLPRIVPERASFLSGRVRLDVEHPLVLRSVEAEGFRQSEALSVSPTGETWRLEQFLDKARLCFVAAAPSVETTASVVERVSAADGVPRAEAEVRFAARSGRDFVVECGIGGGWDVLRVSPVAGEIAQWSTAIGANGRRSLLVEFLDPLEPGGPRAFRIMARPAHPEASLALPVLRPLNAVSVETAALVAPEAAEVVLRLESAGFRRHAKDDVPAFVAESTLWRSLDRGSAPPLVLSSSGEMLSRVVLPASGSEGEEPPVEAPRPDPSASQPTDVVRHSAAGAASDSGARWFGPLELDSILPTSGGAELHRVVYRLRPVAEAAGFRFKLPPASRLVVAQVDGRDVRAARLDDQFVLPQLAAGTSHVIEIRYALAMREAGWLRQSRTVPLPTASFEPTAFRWRLAVPRSMGLVTSPEGLVLAGAPAFIPWTVRFFGPFGRPADSDVFSPLAPLESIAAPEGGSGSTRSQTGGVESTDAARFFPAGWPVHTASALRPPPELAVRLWSLPHSRLAAWILSAVVLLCGLALRIVRFRGRQKLALLWIGLCLTAAIVSRPDVAQIAGGGLWAAMVVVLLPRGWLLRPVQREASSAPAVPSTRSGSAVAVGALLLPAVLGLASAQTSAQQPSAPPLPNSAPPSVPPLPKGGPGGVAEASPRSTPPAPPLEGGGTTASKGATIELDPAAAPGGVDLTYAVLVPVDAERRLSTDAPFVYLSEPLYRRLIQQQPAGVGEVDALIHSAAYEAVVDEQRTVRLTARWRVAVLSRGTVRLQLPLVGAHLEGTNAGVVDGRPGAVLPAEGGDGFVIELKPPEAASPNERGDDAAVSAPHPEDLLAASLRWHTVTLRLIVPQIDTAGGGGFSLQIPPAAIGQLSLTLPSSFPTVHVGDGEVLPRDAGERQVEIRLGKTSQLEVEWSRTPGGAAAMPSITADVASRIEVRPARLDYRCRITYRAGEAALRAVVWELPSGMVVAETPSGVRALTPLDSPGPRRRVLVEFEEPRSGEFTLEVPLLLPVPSPLERIRVPTVPLVATHPGFPAARLANHEIAVVAPPEYRLQPPVEIAPGLRDLPVESFLKHFPELAAEERRPWRAWQVLAGSVLELTLDFERPERRVRSPTSRPSSASR
ncbi:MAG: hypothetical protein KY476_12310, partial [Planctomycetes bacterium]|nr:hypothetical protein [Planctomycetota bacterium]